MTNCVPLSISKLSAENDSPLFSPIDLTIQTGEFVCVTGEHGSGKTLIIDTLMGYRQDYVKGDVLFWGEEYSSKSRLVLNKRIGWITTYEEDYPLGLDVERFLDLISPFYNCWDKPFVKELINSFKLDPKAMLSKLELEELAKLKLIKALAFHPDLLVIDDLTVELPPLEKERILKTLCSSFKNDELAVLYLMHTKEETPEKASVVYQLNKNGLSKQ